VWFLNGKINRQWICISAYHRSWHHLGLMRMSGIDLGNVSSSPLSSSSSEPGRVCSLFDGFMLGPAPFVCVEDGHYEMAGIMYETHDFFFSLVTLGHAVTSLSKMALYR
jgi:hypothetical protein